MLCVRTYNTYVAKREKTSETTAVVVSIYKGDSDVISSAHYDISLYYIVTCCRHCIAEWSPPLAIKFKFDPSPPLSCNTVTTHVLRI